jgi:hypothetical protein
MKIELRQWSRVSATGASSDASGAAGATAGADEKLTQSALVAQSENRIRKPGLMAGASGGE